MKDIIFPIKLFSVTKSGAPIIIEGTPGIRQYVGKGQHRPPGTYQRWLLTAELSALEAWLGYRVNFPAPLYHGFTILGERGDIDFNIFTVDMNDGEYAGFWFIPSDGQIAKLEMAIPEVLVIND